MQYYADQELAERYARSRPYFHPVVIEQLRRKLDESLPLQRALDVGCGTGQSAIVLRTVASLVYGVDGSRSMLSTAFAGNNVVYLQAVAEMLPFVDRSFALVTTSRAFHWFDRTSFLGEARRLLRQGGWLVLYGNRFVDGSVEDSPAFNTWLQHYQARYPGPPRNYAPITPAEANAAGFGLLERQRYVNNWTFRLDDLVDYLMTLSRATLAIENGEETAEEVRAWLSRTLGPCFSEGIAAFQFSGTIEYLR